MSEHKTSSAEESLCEETENNTDLETDIEDNDDSQQLRTELEEAKLKAKEYYDHLQRLKAEFDNFRKRTAKEKGEIARYASENIILSLLPILDNFERALESAQNNQEFDSFCQGVEMIFRQLLKVLEEEGLKPIEAEGKPFDPNLHEAFIREESSEEENIVLEELQKGYFLKDKVIRPSRVKVSCKLSD
ncbi:MAG: nucleotide exchange factor GrpE [Desulfitobacteriia bacterium]